MVGGGGGGFIVITVFHPTSSCVVVEFVVVVGVGLCQYIKSYQHLGSLLLYMPPEGRVGLLVPQIFLSTGILICIIWPQI